MWCATHSSTTISHFKLRLTHARGTMPSSCAAHLIMCGLCYVLPS